VNRQYKPGVTEVPGFLYAPSLDGLEASPMWLPVSSLQNYRIITLVTVPTDFMIATTGIHVLADVFFRRSVTAHVDTED